MAAPVPLSPETDATIAGGNRSAGSVRMLTAQAEYENVARLIRAIARKALPVSTAGIPDIMSNTQIVMTVDNALHITVAAVAAVGDFEVVYKTLDVA